MEGVILEGCPITDVKNLHGKIQNMKKVEADKRTLYLVLILSGINMYLKLAFWRMIRMYAFYRNQLHYVSYKCTYTYM